MFVTTYNFIIYIKNVRALYNLWKWVVQINIETIVFHKFLTVNIQAGNTL